MKFKKLVLITASTVVAGAGLIALAAACHDKNQKKPGNGDNEKVKSDGKKIENKSPQSAQKQNINPELNQKQTDKSDAKKESEKSTNLSKIQQKQQENNNTQKEQTPKLNQESAKNQNNDSTQNSEQKLNNLNSESQKTIKNKQDNQKLSEQINKSQISNPAQENQPKDNKKLIKQKIPQHSDKNHNNDSTQDHDQQSNIIVPEPQKQQEKEKEKLNKIVEKPKDITKVNEISDVNFVSENPIINQEIDYTSYIDLKINNKYLKSDSNKSFKVLLVPVNKANNQKIESYIYHKNEKALDNDTFTFYLNNVDFNETYLLQSVTVLNYSHDWKEIISEPMSLNLNDKIKETKIVVQKINHEVELNNEEQKKIPVTVEAKIIKKENNYSIELVFNNTSNKEQINNKYVNINITHGDYRGLSTIHNLERYSYKIEENKITIPLDSRYVQKDKELHVILQGITDSENTNIKSTIFRLDYNNSNAVVDANKNLVFKLKNLI